MLSAYVLIDQSSYLFFTSTYTVKSVVGARKGVEFVYYYLKNGHRVSGEVFDEYAHSALPLTANEATSDEWVSIVEGYNRALPGKHPSGEKKALSDALERCLESGISGREMYVLSDFMVYENAKLMELLATLGEKNRVTLVQLTDRLEENPPLKQWLGDGRHEFMFRGEDERVRYKQLREDGKRQWINFSRENNIVFTEIFTDNAS